MRQLVTIDRERVARSRMRFALSSHKNATTSPREKSLLMASVIERTDQRTDLWEAARSLIEQRGCQRREEPFKLASGQFSNDYIDGKYAVADGRNLGLISRAVVELAAANKMDFDAAGGLTMGADALAHGVAMVSGSGSQ